MGMTLELYSMSLLTFFFPVHKILNIEKILIHHRETTFGQAKGNTKLGVFPYLARNVTSKLWSFEGSKYNAG